MFLLSAAIARELQLHDIVLQPQCLSIIWRSNSPDMDVDNSVGSVQICTANGSCTHIFVSNHIFHLPRSKCDPGCVVHWRNGSASHHCLLIENWSILVQNSTTTACRNDTCISVASVVKNINTGVYSSSAVHRVESDADTQSRSGFCAEDYSVRAKLYELSDSVEILDSCYPCNLNTDVILLSYVLSSNLSHISEFPLQSCDPIFLPTSRTIVKGKSS